MKTKYLVLFVIATVISQYSFSQSLLIKGFFKNSDKKLIQVNYLLLSNNKVVCNGNDKKMEIDLALNSDYTLIVSKNGFITKTVSFSTYTNAKDEFYFEFEMFLKEENVHDNTLTASSANVYYDRKLGAFNYEINKKNIHNINN